MSESASPKWRCWLQESPTVPGARAASGGLGRTGEARVVLGVWVYLGWHSKNESVSPDSRMPLKRSPRQPPGYSGMCYCPCLGLLPVGKEHSMGRGGGGARGDLEKNLRSGSDCCVEGGIRKPELGVCSGGIVCILSPGLGELESRRRNPRK